MFFSASCFYIGKGLFITNKHLFEEEKNYYKNLRDLPLLSHLLKEKLNHNSSFNQKNVSNNSENYSSILNKYSSLISKIPNSQVRISNQYIKNIFQTSYITAELYYITENEIDIAFLKLKKSDEKVLSNNNIFGLDLDFNIKLKELDEVYSFNYHYFKMKDQRYFNSCFYTVRFINSFKEWKYK